MASNGQTPQPASLGTLFLRAARLCLGHWAIFLGLVLVACGLQAGLYYAFHRTQTIVILADALVTPVLSATIFAIVHNDLGVEPFTVGEIAGRVAERAWAVIALSAVPTLFSPQLYHLDPTGSDAAVLQSVLYFVSLLLIFSPVYATLEKQVRTLALIPRSIARSTVLIFQGNFWRAAVLIALALAASELIDSATGALAHARVRDGFFWGFAPLDAAFTVPLSVLLVLVYADALAREKRRPTGSP